MLYTPPTGSTDPNAPYLGKNVAIGQQGSKIPPAAVEATQREIVAAIVAGGLTPTGSDTQQLTKSIRGGGLTYFADVGAQNALAVLPSPVYLALAAGNEFRVSAAFACTGAATLQVNNCPAVQIRKSGGNALSGGEWAQGDILWFIFDGQFFQLMGSQGASSSVVTSSIVMNVPSQFSTIRAALLAASLLIIAPNVSVIIQVAPGYVESLTALTGPWRISMPYGQQVTIVGPPLSGNYPSYSEIAGLSNADTLTLLKSRFNARVECVGTGAMEVYFGGLNIENMLFVGDGTASGGFYGWKVGSWSSKVGFGFTGGQNCWVHNFGLDNIRAELLSAIQGINLGSTYATQHAFHISHGSQLECNTGNLLAMRSQHGCILQNGGTLALDSSSGTIDFSNNTISGIGSPDYGIVNAFNATGVRLRGNAYGINMALYSAVALPSGGQTVFAGNTTLDILLNYSSTAYTYGCALPSGSSPARGAAPANSLSSVV